MTTPYRTADSLPFACSDCGRRSPCAAECPCGAGPLVDLQKPEFRAMIVEIEDRRADSHAQTLLWIGVAVGIALGVFVLATMPIVLLLIPLPIPFSMAIKVIAMMIAFALGATKVLAKVWPATRRFPELVAQRQTVALPTRMHAPQRATIIGVALVLALGVAITIAIPFGKAWIVQEELEHSATLRRRYASLLDCANDRPSPLDDAKKEWPRSCNKPLQALYEAVDNRSADAPLRAALGDKFHCSVKCDAEGLDKHFGEITLAFQAMGQHVDARAEDQPNAFGSPFTPRSPYASGGLHDYPRRSPPRPSTAWDE